MGHTLRKIGNSISCYAMQWDSLSQDGGRLGNPYNLLGKSWVSLSTLPGTDSDGACVWLTRDAPYQPHIKVHARSIQPVNDIFQ